MKILVVSDTHGFHRNLEKVLERIGKIDKLIHLGDVEGGDDYINVIAGCPTHIVAGNNDFWSDLPNEDDLFIRGHHIFITHGHYLYVSRGEERLIAEAKRRGADIVIYGHIHRPVHHEEDGVLVLNPGSIAFPRQQGRKATYMIMDIDEAGNVDAKIEFV